MTIAQALKKYSKIEADLLLGHVLKQPKEFLYLHGEQKLSPAQLRKFEVFAKKRVAGMPVAYLLGYKYFYGLKFKVNRSVLIPRPESEWLVDEALRIVKTKNRSKQMKILDLGTGSGCIAVSIAKNANSKGVKVFASDISASALKVAQANAKANKVLIKFSKRNLLAGAKDKFDIIIANLPYVPVSDYKKLYRNLEYEPKLALTDGSDNFPLIYKFLAQAPKYLNTGGVIIIETDPKFFKQFKTKNARVIKDIQNLKRFAVIKL